MAAASGQSEDRDRMVRHIRAATGIEERAILAAFASVPRQSFVPEADRGSAYDDRALPLSEMQTISQPSMIAIMLYALDVRPHHRVLEVGAGSGYAAALLGKLAKDVHAIEIRPALALRARQNLAQVGIANVRVHVGDGSQGLPEFAPFDRILVSAGARAVPDPLVLQLAPLGRIAIPVGNSDAQILLIGERDEAGQLVWKESIPCMFVPLVHRGALPLAPTE